MPTYTTKSGQPITISDAERERFLRDNPGDEGRIAEAFAGDEEGTRFGGGAAQPQQSPAMSGLAAAGPEATPLAVGGGGAAEVGGTAVDAAPDTGSLFKGFGSSVGSAVADLGGAAQPGTPTQAYGAPFRPNLGMRTVSNENSPLAGLRRAY